MWSPDSFPPAAAHALVFWAGNRTPALSELFWLHHFDRANDQCGGHGMSQHTIGFVVSLELCFEVCSLSKIWLLWFYRWWGAETVAFLSCSLVLMDKVNSTIGILEYLLFINHEAKSNHNVNYSLTNLIMQNFFFFSPNVLIIACVDTTWIISLGMHVLWGSHVKLSCCSPRVDIVISLYCIQDDPSSVQEVCIFG